MALSARDHLVPSLLDRLTDLEPDVSTEPGWARSQGPRELMDGVKRDLEGLLNTRCAQPSGQSLPGELEQSILTYGIQDLTWSNSNDDDHRERVRAEVEAAIRRFEPRLVDLQVNLRPRENDFDRKLSLVIDATLLCEPEPVSVTFDTVIQPGSGYCEVKAL